MTIRPYLLVAIVMVAAVVPARVQAEKGRQEAAAHAEKGLRAYNLGNFDDAIAEFSKSYDLDPTPALLYNLGHANRGAGNLDRAIFFYERFLAESKKLGEKANKEKMARAKDLIAQLQAKIAAANAEKAKSTAPAPAPSAPQPTAPPSPAPSSPSAAVREKSETVPPRPTVARTATSTNQPATEPQGSAPDPSAPAQAGSPKRTLAWVAGGAAVAALGAGLVFQLRASGKLSTFSANCAIDDVNGEIVPNSGHTLPECTGLHDDWKSGNRWALAGYVTGAAFAATSAILFITSRTESSISQPHAHVDCRPGLAAIVCGGAF